MVQLTLLFSLDGDSFVRFCLPRIGDGVRCLIVAGGLHLSRRILRSMLILCPNVQYLDASYTNVTDISFKGYSSMYHVYVLCVLFLLNVIIIDCHSVCL